MAGGFRDLKRRIRSIQNTKKITKAMEMVSAAKMRKAVDRVLASRDYATYGWQMLLDLSARVDVNLHALLEIRDLKKMAVIVISSNRGLCGAFNQNIIRLVGKVVSEQNINNDIETDIIIMGKKGQGIVRQGFKAVAEFDKQDVATGMKDVLPLARMVMDGYIKGKYDKVVMVYTDYISSLKQIPRVRQILPIVKEDLYLGKTETKKSETDKKVNMDFDFLYEPSSVKVLDYLLPRLMEMQIYQALLESDASEHSARMMSMRNATDAAGDMIDDLTLIYNQARQASITAELADISGGRLALED